MNTPAHPDDPKHIAGCSVCQASARQEAAELGIDLYRVWSRVAAEAWAPATSTVERWAGQLLRSPGLARALVTTPSLVLSWIGATAVVLFVGIIATRSTGTPWVQLVAPALAAAGIGYAYGPGIDPAFELSRSMAISDRLVLIVRALAVFGLNAIFGVIASVFASSATGVTLTWLAPMTAVSALALAIATWSHSPAVGVAGAFAVWSIVVLGSEVGAGDAGAALGVALIPVYAICAVACVVAALAATSGNRERTTAWG